MTWSGDLSASQNVPRHMGASTGGIVRDQRREDGPGGIMIVTRPGKGQDGAPAWDFDAILDALGHRDEDIRPFAARFESGRTM